VLMAWSLVVLVRAILVPRLKEKRGWNPTKGTTPSSFQRK
jgi:hypothetical protein